MESVDQVTKDIARQNLEYSILSLRKAVSGIYNSDLFDSSAEAITFWKKETSKRRQEFDLIDQGGQWIA